MNLKELQQLHASLVDFQDFAHSNCDGDESGVYEEMMEHYSKSMNIIKKARHKIYLKNAMAVALRKQRKDLNKK